MADEMEVELTVQHCNVYESERRAGEFRRISYRIL